MGNQSGVVAASSIPRDLGVRRLLTTQALGLELKQSDKTNFLLIFNTTRHQVLMANKRIKTKLQCCPIYAHADSFSSRPDETNKHPTGPELKE